MKSRNFLVIAAVLALFSCPVPAPAADTASPAPTVQYQYPDIDQPIRPTLDMAERYRALQKKGLELEDQINRVQGAERPELEGHLKEMAALEKERREAAERLSRAKENAGWSGLGGSLGILGLILPMINPAAPVALVVLVFLLVTAYLLWRKKDSAFTVPFLEMNASLLELLGFGGVKIKSGTGNRLLLRLVLIVAAVLALLAAAIPTALAQDTVSPSGVALWDVRSQNFDQNVSDLKTVKDLTGFERLAFILAHPVAETLDLKEATSLWKDGKLVFQREPSLEFTTRKLRLNSFEYIYLLGRCYYEIKKDDLAFFHFHMLTDLRAHPLQDPIGGQMYLLDLLEVAMGSNRMNRFQDLERLFLENARKDLRFQLADFIVFHVDRARGLELFKRLLPGNFPPAMELLGRIITRMKPGESYEFCNAALNELVRAGMDTGGMLRLLVDQWPKLKEADPEGRARDNFLELIKTAVGYPGQASLKLKALGLLLDEGRQDFVRAELSRLSQQDAGRMPIGDYLAMVTLFHKLGDNLTADSLLDQSYTAAYLRSPDAMREILAYCLEKKDLVRANKAMEAIFANFSGAVSAATTPRLLELLGVKQPFPWESLPLQGFYALLQDRVDNRTNARTRMEAALKPDLETALKTYDQDMNLDLNILYFLLKLYQGQNDHQRFENVWPLYQDAAVGYWDRNRERWEKAAAALEKQVKELEAEKRRLMPTPEDLEAGKRALRDEIDGLNGRASTLEVKSALRGATGSLIFILTTIVLLAAFVYVLSRAAYHCRRTNSWRSAVFFLRLMEGEGFFLMMTIFFLPLGVFFTMGAQLLLRLIEPGPVPETEAPPRENPEPRTAA